MRKKSETPPPTALTHPLVRQWFHSYEAERPEVIQWQGYIVAEVAAGQFLVQLFEWVLGEPTKRVIVPLADMTRWDFYATNKAMNYAYEKYAAIQKYKWEQDHPIPPDALNQPPKFERVN